MSPFEKAKLYLHNYILDMNAPITGWIFLADELDEWTVGHRDHIEREIKDISVIIMPRGLSYVTI